MIKSSQVIKLIISLLLPLVLGAIAGMFTSKAVPEWYMSLKAPSFSPPNWLFGPVWTALYILLGISFFLVWSQQRSRNRNIAVLIYFVQLVLNFMWTFLFFYFHLIGFALIEIIVLWIFIVMMMRKFYTVKKVSTYLNIPYLLWVSFATMLTAGYYFLN